MKWRVVAVVGLMTLVSIGVVAESPMPVSPGGQTGTDVISGRCPTFHWTSVEGAESVELVVYRVSKEESENQSGPILTVRLPGSAHGWTPSLDQCLELGQRYAWSVRTTGKSGETEWSEASLFEVSASPSVAEVEEALAVLRRYVAGEAGARIREREADEPERRRSVVEREGRRKVSTNANASASAADSEYTFNLTGNAHFDFSASEDFILDKSASNTDPVLHATASEYGLIGKSGNEMFNVRSKRFYAESSFNYLAYSDRRLKQNIRPIVGALESVASLEGVAYALRSEYLAPARPDRVVEEEFLRENQMGFIAQDVEKVLPQLVQTDDETGYKTVGYMGVIPLLVEAVKTQKHHIESQQQVISSLEARLIAIERLLSRE